MAYTVSRWSAFVTGVVARVRNRATSISGDNLVVTCVRSGLYERIACIGD